MAVKDYDVAAAFQAIEYELINSFFRNMKKHKVDEVKEQKEWEMWQVKQLQELDLYKKRNAEKYGTKFTDINKTIAEMIRLSNEEGQMDQEAEILSAMEKGLKPQRAPEQMTAQFFRTNDRKLDTLINATVSDMERAEVAVLRKADDVYRKTIFNAMVYANTGAGTYEKAIDMATKDFMKAGLTCVEYKNGSKHTISDYADMAVRTANKRAYLQGEGAKRQEWGVHTVIVNKRLMACPHCMPFAGKVFIDDVWGGGTAADGDYPLLSEAVAAGLYHPRCKDSHTAYFPGITGKPKKYTKAEVKEAEKAEEQERKADYAERQAESYQRVADTRLDPENKRQEQARADRWSRLSDKYHELANRADDPGLRMFYDRREGEFKSVSTNDRLKKRFKNVHYKEGDTYTSSTIRIGYEDITNSWFKDTIPNSHEVGRLQSYTKDGVEYVVDGHNVIMKPSPNEIRVANILKEKVGGSIFHVPKINFPKEIKTPDFLFNGIGYDLKTIKGCGRSTLRDAVKRKLGQSQRFIFDLSNSALTEQDVEKQMYMMFRDPHTAFVNEIVIIRGDEIDKVYKRI